MEQHGWNAWGGLTSLTALVLLCCITRGDGSRPAADLANLIMNPDFRVHPGNQPANYQITGSAVFGNLGDARNVAGWGVALKSI